MTKHEESKKDGVEDIITPVTGSDDMETKIQGEVEGLPPAPVLPAAEQKPWRLWVIFGSIAVVAALVAGFFWVGMARPPVETSEASPPPILGRPAGTIVVGSISPDDIAGEIEEFQPFIDYVATRLADQGINSGKVVVASSVAEMAQLFRQEEVDIFIDSPFPTFAVDRLVGSKPLVARWKKGAERIHSVVFVSAESGFDDIGDLKGKTIAFEEPSSTSGYFLPRATLEQAGMTLAQQPEGATNGDLRYVFTYDEEKIIEQVLAGKAQAGAMRDKTLEELAEETGDEFKVLLTSPEVYRHIVTVRGDIDTELEAALQEILIGMHETDEGQSVLAEFSKTAKFSLFPADFSAYEGIESLIELVEEEIVRQ